MEDSKVQFQTALTQLQAGLHVLSAQFEGKRAGVVVRSVQPAADEPPLLCVAVKRGHWIEPVIRDSHCFAISKIGSADRLLTRKFAETARPRDGDPFDCIPTVRLVTGAPVIERATLALDCEVFRHFDIEADHELYVGIVVATRIRHPHDAEPPQVEMGQMLGAAPRKDE
jgi:flavin reductase (DIM6/NTAB) family NADH-FMN oxidoreductase RutF